MNLKKNKQGVIELNGEPIVEWFEKRNLIPCIMTYARTNGNQKCCLAGAMGFAAVEGKMAFKEFEQWMDTHIPASSPIKKIAETLGMDAEDLRAIEQGYMFNVYGGNGMISLGRDARNELLKHFGTLTL